MEQRSDEWFAARCGKVTASRIADLVAKTKTGWGASRANYMAELVAERLTNTPAERFSNAAMQWGTDHEPDAIAAYEFFKDCAVEPVGFVDHPKIAMTGASPDGRVGKDGLVEIKCPKTATHIDTLLSGKVERKYLLQMQWQMECEKRQWCDFVSFDPRMPGSMQMFCLRVERDDKLLGTLREQVDEFLAELDAKVVRLVDLYEPKAVA